MKIDDAKRWFLLALVIKIAICLLIIYNKDLNTSEGDHAWGVAVAGDAVSYIQASDNIIQKGTYSYSPLSESVAEPHTGRIPGYELIIAPLRYLFSEKPGLQLVVLLQVLLASFSVYCLAKIAYLAFNKNKYCFYLTFFGYSISSYITIFDISILTESFAMSSLILAVYYLFRNENKWDLILSGIFITWSITLRQYVLPVYFVAVLYLILKHRKSIGYLSLFDRKLLVQISLMVAPFLVFETVWVSRNFAARGEFIPLVDDVNGGATRYAPTKEFRLFYFVQSWGGDAVDWNPKAEIALFWPNALAPNPTYTSVEQLPDYIYTSKYNADSLKKVREYMLIALDSTKPATERARCDQWLITNLEHYRQSFIKEKPFRYHVYSRLRLLPKFIFHSGTYNLSKQPFSELSLAGKLYKLGYTLIYWLVLLGGFAGILILLFRYRTPETLLIVFIPLYIVFICCFLRRIEYRYFFPAYPFLLISMVYFVRQVGDRFFRKKLL